MDQPTSSGRLGRGEALAAHARKTLSPIGITPLTRKSKQVYQVAFSYLGVQCREVVDLPHSKANELYCVRLRAEILGKISRQQFHYAEYFPDSKRVGVLGEGPRKSGTLKEVLEAYRDRVKHTLEPSTFDSYRKTIDYKLVPWCGDKKLTDLRPADIREWVGVQSTTLKTIRNNLLPLRTVMDEAVADELIKVSPFASVDIAKLVPVAKRESEFEPAPYTVFELATLLDNIPLAERWVFQLWAYTGLRTGELIGLRWKRVAESRRFIKVQETTTIGLDKDRPKTKSGVRTLTLLPAAQQALDELHTIALATDSDGPESRVCFYGRGRDQNTTWGYDSLSSAWERAHRGTTIPYRTPYQLRHTFASQLLSQGDSAVQISHLLGHKTVEMVTRTYGRWVSEGEQLGGARKERQYGLEKLVVGATKCESHVKAVNEQERTGPTEERGGQSKPQEKPLESTT